MSSIETPSSRAESLNLDRETPLVEFRGARVRREGRTILNVDHLAIYPGERIAVLGPNGAGKSTLVQVITREVMPLFAEPAPVRWLGRERIETARLRGLCGVVSSRQQWVLDVHLTVAEVVLAAIYGALVVPPWVRTTESDRIAAQRAIDEVGLTGFEHRDLTTLSTGEARRTAVARALVHDPQVLILDEPTAGLDPTAAWALRDTMRRVTAAGRTLILVTHHVEDIVSSIDRIVLVKDGQIVGDGPKAEVLTDETISALYNISVALDERDGEYRLWEDHRDRASD